MIEPAVACLLIGHENSGIGTFLSGKSRHAQESRTRRILAPRARFELATLRLTAECSTVELPGNSADNLFIVLCLQRSSQPADVARLHCDQFCAHLSAPSRRGQHPETDGWIYRWLMFSDACPAIRDS